MQNISLKIVKYLWLLYSLRGVVFNKFDISLIKRTKLMLLLNLKSSFIKQREYKFLFVTTPEPKRSYSSTVFF